jgi:DNA polymerase-3 subunit epsilon
LIIHNAEFDVSFLNSERVRLELEPLPMDCAIDTLRLARKLFPGSQVSLDALCRRFQIDNSDRALHGALMDAKLLAEVYLELIGGRQQHMELTSKVSITTIESKTSARRQRPHAPSLEEEALHLKFLKKLKQPIWNS